jgi:hypothetical protein
LKTTNIVLQRTFEKERKCLGMELDELKRKVELIQNELDKQGKELRAEIDSFTTGLNMCTEENSVLCNLILKDVLHGWSRNGQKPINDVLFRRVEVFDEKKKSLLCLKRTALDMDLDFVTLSYLLIHGRQFLVIR